jgi:hypothetical protein
MEKAMPALLEELNMRMTGEKLVSHKHMACNCKLLLFFFSPASSGSKVVHRSFLSVVRGILTVI